MRDLPFFRRIKRTFAPMSGSLCVNPKMGPLAVPKKPEGTLICTQGMLPRRFLPNVRRFHGGSRLFFLRSHVLWCKRSEFVSGLTDLKKRLRLPNASGQNARAGRASGTRCSQGTKPLVRWLVCSSASIRNPGQDFLALKRVVFKSPGFCHLARGLHWGAGS